jgi:hypothetical protein
MIKYLSGSVALASVGQCRRHKYDVINFLEKYKIVAMFITIDPQNKDNLLYISLADSQKNGFNKWCEAHDANRTSDQGGAADIGPDPDFDSGIMTPPERPHRPWLVPGVGTL